MIRTDYELKNKLDRIADLQVENGVLQKRTDEQMAKTTLSNLKESL